MSFAALFALIDGLEFKEALSCAFGEKRGALKYLSVCVNQQCLRQV